MITYPLAPNAIFRTIQGEGALLGTPMVFIRLAGCSIGCPLCDTDYRKHSKASAAEIAERAAALKTPATRWAWITGGEPTDHDCGPLIEALRNVGFDVAMATAGHRPVPPTWHIRWLSVSPHDPAQWVQKWGSELKLVPGLNGHGLNAFDVSSIRFDHRFVSPCDGVPATVAECQEWVAWYPEWKMTTQAHKQWGLS